MIYAYCVRRSGEAPPPDGLLGLEQARVRLLEEGSLGFWVSEGPSLPPTADRLRDHDRVVREALRTATPLPIRYGAGCFASEQAAREALVDGVEPLTAGLARVAGRVEMGVRVDWDPPGPDAADSAASGQATRPARSTGSDRPGAGRAYLETRKRELERDHATRRAAEEAVARVEAELALDELPAVRSVLPDPRTAGIVAHLVRRAEVQRYRKCVEEAAGALPAYRLSVTGPWAPYSFA